MAFYEGSKLLSMQDINGDKPEIYMCTSNRSAGKTTYFNKYALSSFKKRGEKFALLYRFNYELDQVADKFFKDINTLFFPKDEMESERRAMGIYHELMLNGQPCGYAISINSADQIKKYSHLFADTQRIIFDEFQSETDHYCDNEVKKFRSIHTSIARGGGKQVRYLPVYMISNPVTLLNPYYVAMGISNRLRDDTKFLKGEGFVLENAFNESACKAQQESAFNRAFGNDIVNKYTAQGVYLNDNKAFIEKPQGAGKYVATLKCLGRNFAVRSYAELGIIYCDNHADMTFPVKISVTTEDHQINYVMLRQNKVMLDTMRFYFDRGCFRFRDLACKDAILKALSY